MKADNKKIWIRGQFVEVTDEVYAAYMKGDRKIRYFENDLKTGRTVKDKDGNIKQTLPSREDSLDRLMEDNAQQFLDSHESVEDIVIQKISAEKLHMALLRLADIFSRLGYMERQGSGLNKIRNAYRSAENYTPDKEPVFYSDRVEFTVTLKNLNFSASENEAKSEAKNEAENYRLTELEERLCNLLLEYPELTQSEIRERLDLSRSKVQRMMRKLTEDGIIIREGSRRKGYWTIHL